MLTFSGLVLCALPLCVLYACIGAALIGDVPWWFMCLQATCYFVYRMLDEMDGKQARRTKNGSPLGMVFDHGVDALCAGILPLVFSRIINVGDNLIAKIFFCTVYQAFHFVTLEHYYLGQMILPEINGIADGCLVVTPLCLITAYTGNNYWATPICDGRWLNIEGVDDLCLG